MRSRYFETTSRLHGGKAYSIEAAWIQADPLHRPRVVPEASSKIASPSGSRVVVTAHVELAAPLSEADGEDLVGHVGSVLHEALKAKKRSP